MNKRDTIILGLVFAAIILLMGLRLRRSGTDPEVVGASITPDNAWGPAPTWANVPTDRFLMPPPLGAYVRSRNAPINDNAAAPTMYGCGGC